MHDKPSTQDGYLPNVAQQARATGLYLATKLGDMLDDVVIIGGLVPSLLIEQSHAEVVPHVGTMDLDLGLALALLDDERYEDLVARLREAGFIPDKNERGNPSRHRWQLAEQGIKLDFLIPPSRTDERGGSLRQIRPDFAAIITPGLHLAFLDRKRVEIDGHTIKGERANRSVWVCGPGAYVVLKALAHANRGANKDAYDLFYLLQNFSGGLPEIAARMQPLLFDVETQRALDILRRDFSQHDGLGPRRVAEFMTRGPDDEIQADVVGYVHELLRRCDLG